MKKVIIIGASSGINNRDIAIIFENLTKLFFTGIWII